MADSDPYLQDRERMVANQLEGRGIRDARVLAALREVPRHLFVPEEHRHLAYADGPLPIGQGQTISQPYIVALMTQLLALQEDNSVLEIGTGSGYQAAVLSHLAKTVHTIEQYGELAARARQVLDMLGILNVHVHVGDGSNGWPKCAPYAGIIATAAAPRVPEPFLAQLSDGGRLVLPVGGQDGQLLQVWHRQGEDFDRDTIAPVAFVPLRGKHGWGEEDWRYR
jgi:protein-L-isoaspartate(D-aspartate) O-methyltransferase